MKKFKRKNIKINKLSSIIVLTLILILLLTSFFISKYLKRINNTLLKISEAEITRITYEFITTKINHNIINNETIKDILIFTKNKEDEILYVDFNYDKAYLILDRVSKILNDSIASLNNGEVLINYYDYKNSHKTNGLTLFIPVGTIFNNTYLYNLGPKIPVKINYIGMTLTNLETKVTNYGMNNALVELFVHIEISNQIIAPSKTKDLKLNYDAVISSAMIQGKVPSFYNGSISKTSD